MSVELRARAGGDAHAAAVVAALHAHPPGGLFFWWGGGWRARVGFLSLGARIATFETCSGPSFSITPTGMFGRPGSGRWWRLTMFRPSTYTRSRLGSTRITLPVLPLSLPAITTTSSSVRILITAPPARG